MCVASVIFDHYWEKWNRPCQPTWPEVYPYPHVKPSKPTITPEEIEEFRRLLERAREYDKKNNQPDCELEEKRRKIKELADKEGVEMDFL